MLKRKTDFEKLREVLHTIQASGASKTSFILTSLEWVSNVGGGLHIEFSTYIQVTLQYSHNRQLVEILD